MPSPLIPLLDLAHQAREAGSSQELVFLLVNDSRSLLRYRQAVLWLEAGGIRGLSGVTDLDADAPYAQWAQRVCAALQGRPAGPVDAMALPPALAGEWPDWLPLHALWLPVPAGPAAQGAAPVGGLLLAGEDVFPEAVLPLLQEWMHVWAHAWAGLSRPRRWWEALLRREPGPAAEKTPPRAWWRRRPLQIAAAVVLLLAVPVRLTVLAPGELVAADAAVVRAPLDGVVDRFDVQPNQTVTQGQALFSFDQAPIASRLDVARQALATAEVEYRQAAQLALSDVRSKGQLAVVQGRIEERRAEAAFLEDQFRRSRVVAPRAGLVIFDDPSEWEGRPVRTGERIMRVVDPQQIEVEAWVPVGDAIPLAVGSELRLYLASTPLDPLTARLRYMAHDPVQRPDGNYAYRVRAVPESAADRRIGLKGTARLQAGWVPLAYWVLRRPLAVVRQYLAF